MNHFPVEPAFAMTVEKAQGRTLKRVILALSNRSAHNCQMDYASLYVSLSRVKHREDMRLLLAGETIVQQIQSLEYCTKLKRNKAITAFFEGFKPTVPHQERLDIHWDREVAYECYIQENTGRRVSSCAPHPSNLVGTVLTANQTPSRRGPPGSLVIDVESA